VKITEIRAMRLNVPPRELKTQPRRDAWVVDAEVANPMSRYPKVKRNRALWLPKWEGVWCKVTPRTAPGASATPATAGRSRP
jgi:hypothetical protein